MAGRNIPLVADEYYHVFNRGVARQPTFTTKYDYQRALSTLEYYRFLHPPLKFSKFKTLSQEERNKLLDNRSADKLVDIVSYVLMPNHFHFLLKQITDNGISKYLSQFTNSYTRYFNTKHNRPGPVFQGVFKAVYVETEEQLLHLSRYIHLNPYVSNVVSKTELLAYPWSSLQSYIAEQSFFVDPSSVLHRFKKLNSYRDFVLNHGDYARELEIVKHLTIDLEN